MVTRYRKEWFARYSRGGSSWYPSGYAKHANNDDKPTVAVRLTLDNDPERNIFLLLDPDEAIKLSKHLVIAAEKAIERSQGK